MKTNSEIQLLEEHIIDQIKAGEVIERPSALIKEILENSIDAKSQNIELCLVNNGLDLISISDDGKGINADDLPLAFCRHATSKISRFDDLYKLSSYGFRGEALASIASISKVSCESQNALTKGLIKIEGGETLTHQVEKNSSTETGTKLYIKDLFFNTPARMKFIKSKTSEKNQIKKIVNAYLLTNPHISFQIKWDEQDKLFYNKVDKKNFSKRIKDVLFKNTPIDFIHNENAYNNSHVSLYISKQSNRGNANKQCFIFINERYVQDIQLHKVILASSAALWPEGETGHYIAKISVPSDELDVNVHPNKTVVKLFKHSEIISLLASTAKQLANSLRDSHPTHKEIEQSFDLGESTAREPQNFNYREVDFKNNEETQNYFNNIHQNSASEETQKDIITILKSYKNFSVINYNSDLYIVNTKKLVSEKINTLLAKKNEEQDLAPLMVSKPFKLDSHPSKNCLAFLDEIGFEIDELEAKTFLLRSFPIKLQHFSYTKIVQSILSKSIESLEQFQKDYDYSELLESHISESFIKSIILESSFTKHIETGVLSELSEEKVKKLYEL